MTLTTRKNLSVKALQAHMASEKKYNENTLIEHYISCNSNPKRGYGVFNHDDVLNNYDQYGENEQGCSKAVHLHNHINGAAFEYIVIKRHKKHGWMPNPNGEHDKCTGNQLIDEVNCWLEYAERDEADYLNPILKYFTSKSDQVTATSNTMVRNVVIIAQKAQHIGDLEHACRWAERLNRQNGLNAIPWSTRYEDMEHFAYCQGWRDAIYNGGNSGVIFDYSQGCYKAVFIDYAL